MQTFLPYADFTKSAKALDNKRLGKQRVEAWQILNTLTGKSAGWANHPATKMWQGKEWYLADYGTQICLEWIERGFNDTLLERFISAKHQLTYNRNIPWWLGFKPLHISHQSNLVRKDPEHYKFKVVNNLPYVWCRPDGSYYEGTLTNQSKGQK
jgi:Pyrimidine dimer DNA glycosylase